MISSKNHSDIERSKSSLLLNNGSTILAETGVSVHNKNNDNDEAQRMLDEIIESLKHLGNFILDLLMIYFMYQTQSIYVLCATLFSHMIQTRKSVEKI
jgi:hypothetical protein